jgi:alanyl-tRNA synthetase
MTTDELRKLFLEFFEKRGHRACPSDPLIPPADDKSLLFTGAGMNTFKNEFLQRVPLKFTRAASSQKCLRTGDIEEVGRTDIHHTFFEMLGNFSFNDYFKREAILWAWEFLTDLLHVNPDKLAISVHQEDEEAFRIWAEFFPVERIRRLGDAVNFWPADAPKQGPNGLCGPCSEIFYDRGTESCGHPWCGIECDCKNYRYVELWNLVFQQFDRKDGGVLEPLPFKNIDTGMGLERTAAVVQGVRSDFEIDIFKSLIEDVCRAVGVDYRADPETTRRVRRIADHIRAVTFCIADGILPSNQGRGYVERKLLRQAVRDAVKLGCDDCFLYSLVPTVADVMGDAYPEVKERRESISRIVRAEELRFHEALRQGTNILEDLMQKLRASGEKALPGTEAFRLFDTYGLPIEVAQSILQEAGFSVDTEGFEREMERQRAQARATTSLSGDIFGSGPLVELRERGVSTQFLGYERNETTAAVVALLSDEDIVEMADEGETVSVILDRSTFYGESGGQVGDTGALESQAACFEVTDCKWAEGMLIHFGEVKRGRLKAGDTLTCRPDLRRRAAIRRHHTATHLLHHALRAVLGPHATQAGSLVAPDRLRFDFTHPEAPTPDQLRKVEQIVNDKILENTPVCARHTGLAEARKEGAMALFGEKYGDQVRMIDVGGYSKELCGGLHVNATGEVGLFHIVSEGSVAAGVRRIEAVTGLAALERMRQGDKRTARLAELLKVPETRLEERVNGLLDQIKELRADAKRAPRARGAGGDLLDAARQVHGVRIVAQEIPNADANQLRQLADSLTKKQPSVAALLASKGARGALFIVGLSKDLVERSLNAVEIARAAATELGGGAGGRPDMAQAGGQKGDNIPSALKKAEALVVQGLSSNP